MNKHREKEVIFYDDKDNIAFQSKDGILSGFKLKLKNHDESSINKKIRKVSR